ncbi:hypothetical protein FBD94_10265 [Pedobacter hiemivivus]|uniref:Uncharacterized protein n=1 Tax=Pedobacter hiemivivus TaxID=2530454 RepID=A0A4U1GET6_9SPHI|nr:hypothetical protein EZ444_21400 [Pedobacter hiemivivus]TKC62631.1 hypothetical protein FBD94_10265 [Pedobacter hiemivivus]
MPEEDTHTKHAHRKTVYKETGDPITEREATSGETSSIAGRADFIIRPKRKTRPLGPGHEPGTTPGRDI